MHRTEIRVTVSVVTILFIVCEAVQIHNCRENGVIYIADDTSSPPSITCSDLWVRTASWFITKNGAPNVVAVCESRFSCTTYQPYVEAFRSIDGTSTLRIVQGIRQNADNYTVTCQSASGQDASCLMKVIDALPTVSLVVDGGTTDLYIGDAATLKCIPTRHPQNTLTYVWSGCENITSGPTCQFTVTERHRSIGCKVLYALYTYIPGKTAFVTLNVKRRTVTAAAGSTQDPLTKTTAGDAPVPAIIGGVVGAVVVAIIVVIVVVVYVIKKRRNTPKGAGPPRQSSKQEKNDFEEHLNQIYGTQDPNHKVNGGGYDDFAHTGYVAAGPGHQSHSPLTSLYQHAYQHLPNAAGERYETHEEGLYSSADGDDLETESGSHGPQAARYTNQAGPSHVAAAGTSEEYAVVSKLNTSQTQVTNVPQDEYAVPDKSKISQTQAQNEQENVYANVDKSKLE